MNQENLVLTEQIYQNNGTYVTYPLITSGFDESKIDKLNNIILTDINNILRLYSADAFIPPGTTSDIFLRDTLHISYNIMRKDDRYLSIFYTAMFNSPYAAHPTQLIFTTNIDLQNIRRLKLSDLIQIDEALYDNFLFWEPVGNEMYINEIRGYIRGLGRETLRLGFETADIIGSDNHLGIFSYLKPGKIGISIAVPNYLGDHAEFEENISV